MSEDDDDRGCFENVMAVRLLTEMADFAGTIGETCLDELPRHLNFRDKLNATGIRREVMVAVLHTTRELLTEALGPEVSATVTDLVAGEFGDSCLGGDLGDCDSVIELLENRFGRYERARKDPAATDASMRDFMMGIVGACSLGLEDKPRIDFAAHMGAHVSLWRDALRRWLAELAQ